MSGTEAIDTPNIARPPSASLLRSSARFLVHLAVVYLIVNTVSQWLAGKIHTVILPLIQQHPPTTSGFQFLFSHLLLYSFAPAFVVAFLVAQRYHHPTALLVWVVPATILAFKIATFHSSTIFDDRLAAAIHHYLGGGFRIEEFANWVEFWDIVRNNPDMMRGMDQLHFAAPLYAAIGYCTGTLLSWRLPFPGIQRALSAMRPYSFRRKPQTNGQSE